MALLHWPRPRRAGGSGAFDRRVLQDFARSLSMIVDPGQLHAVIAAQLQEIFRLDRVAIALRDEDAGRYRTVEARGMGVPSAGPADGSTLRLSWPEDGRLARWLRVNEEPLVPAEQPGVGEYVGADEVERLAAAGLRALFPLVAMGRLSGFLLVGGVVEEGGGRTRPLEPAERELMGELAGQAALALENAALLDQQRARIRRLYRAERLATAGELAAGAAHEIRNPLTAIRSTIQYLHETLPEDHPARGDALGLLEEVDRIDEIVEGLLSFARPSEAVFEPTDLVETVRQAVGLLTPQARKQGVELETEAHGPILLVSNEGLLKQLVLNLVLNSLQAMPGGGTVTVRAGALGAAPAERNLPDERSGALLEVSDTGPGIPDELLERVFDPFFTTKPGGTGLGLSICYGIVERHRGEIEIESTARGATVRIRLRGGRS